MATIDVLGYLAGALVAGGVGAATLLKFTGERWVTSKFNAAEAIAAHDRNQELEKLRDGISREFDRVRRLSTHEFEALGRIWKLIVDAYAASDRALARLKRYPDVGSLGDEDLDAFLGSQDVGELDRQMIRRANSGPERQELYSRWHSASGYDRAKKAISDAYFELQRGAIYLPDELESQLDKFLDLLADAVGDASFAFQERLTGTKLGESDRQQKFRSDGRTEFENLRGAVKLRLSEPKT